MNSKILFVVLNLLASAFAFFKSFLFLKYLNEYQLGAILLFQVIVMFFGLFQIGLLNGGYRILSIKKNQDKISAVNNLIYSYIVYLIIAFSVIGYYISFVKDYNTILVISGIITGGMSLVQNWMTNLLIALNKLRDLNILNILSSILSLIFISLIFRFPYVGAIISIASVHVIFLTIFLVKFKELRPGLVKIKFHSIKKLLNLGFIPFLSGVAYLLIDQIDKVAIELFLSTEHLGKFYLAFIFVSLYSLVPSHINNLIFPKTMNLYSEGFIDEVYKEAKLYGIMLFTYCLSVSLLTVFVAPYLVNLVFPDKANQLVYVYYLIPGLFAVTMSRPFTFLLNIALNLRAILKIEVISLIIYIAILGILNHLNLFSLDSVSIAKSSLWIIILFLYILAYYINAQNIKSRKFYKAKDV